MLIIKIINGKTYNTTTATEIASHEHSYQSDFRWCLESLYRTKKGAYFLAGQGGAMSKYAHAVSTGGWSNGEGIIPLDDTDALEWCESHDIDIDIIEAEFGDLVTEA